MTKVIIAEDNLAILNVLAKNLESLGLEVFKATNGEEALEILSSKDNIDLILSDVMMPKMDGLKLCKIVKENENWSFIPFILLTAHGDNESHIEAMDSGADDFLKKPIKMPVLKARIKNFLKRQENIKKKISESAKINEVYLDGFELLERIGVGTYGSVYRAIQSELEREVAIKIIHPQYSQDEKVLKRFLREGQAMCSVRHPGAAAVYSLHVSEGRPYIVMEYLGGGCLFKKLKDQNTLPYKEAIEIVKQVCATLDTLHSKDIIHRDIKPGNILFDSENRAVLADFGISLIGQTDRLTQEGTLIGTLPYMAPEQIEEHGIIDGQTDLYSLGIVFYEMLIGDIPFYSPSTQTIFYMILNDMPEKVSDKNPSLPSELDDIINKMLAKDKKDRYKTGSEIISDLEKIT